MKKKSKDVPVHMCPPGDSAIMPCCGRIPFELLSHRMTLNPSLVTCKGNKQRKTA